MFISVRRYNIGSGHTVQAVIERVNDGFVPLLETAPGFIRYSAIASGESEFTTVTEFETAAGIHESDKTAAEWVADNLPVPTMTRVHTAEGEVVIDRRM